MATITDKQQIESTEPLSEQVLKDSTPSRQSYANYFLIILIISFLLFAVYSFVQTKTLYEQQQEKNEALNQQLVVLKKHVSQTDEAFTALTTNLKQSALTTKTTLDELNQRLQTALQQRFYQNQDWLLLKARYYLELAQINNHWTQNPNATILLLQQADQLLKEGNNQSHLFTTRQAIAKEIGALKALPVMDIAGLLSQLDALQGLITQLPTKNSIALLETSPSNSEQQETLTWRTQLQYSMNFLKKFVIIRRNDTIQPTLSVEHDAVIRDKLSMNLHIAQWAIIQNNPVVYKNALIQALEIINTNIDKKSTSATAVINQLKELQQLKFNPQPTVINESLALLNQLIDKTDKTGTLPPLPELSGEKQ